MLFSAPREWAQNPLTYSSSGLWSDFQDWPNSSNPSLLSCCLWGCADVAACLSPTSTLGGASPGLGLLWLEVKWLVLGLAYEAYGPTSRIHGGQPRTAQIKIMLAWSKMPTLSLHFTWFNHSGGERVLCLKPSLPPGLLVIK